MKIDTHQHYWRYSAEALPWISDAMPTLRGDFVPVDVLPALQVAGVDAVVAVQARSCADETDYLLGLAQANPQIVGVVGWTDLCALDVSDALDRYVGQPLLKGFRHILQDEPTLQAFLRNPDFSRGVRAVQQRGLVYDVLVFDSQLSSVVDFCAQHNRHWLVLDHVGKPRIRDWPRSSGQPMNKPNLLGDLAQAGLETHLSSEVTGRWLAGLRALAAMPHVVCKLSGLVTEAHWAAGNGVLPRDVKAILECFDFALELFGPTRILYGSDWPMCQLAAPYEAVHGFAQHWASTRLTAHEQNAFWSGNAQRCYGLRPTVALS